jgi:NB-ARC domain/Leucine rich repeat
MAGLIDSCPVKIGQFLHGLAGKLLKYQCLSTFACSNSNYIYRQKKKLNQPMETLSGADRLHGRHDESNRLFTLLLQHTNSRRFPPILSITGEGGMGKTALAKLAFNRPGIADHFKPLIWVSLSPNPDPVETIKRIIEAITGPNCNLSTLDMLQRSLQQLVSGKMFLLVLDGVYTEDIFFWDTIRAPLITAHTGSKVLVTTRNQRTAQYIGSSNSVNLIALNPNSLWLILKDEAFPQTSTGNLVPENFESIGREIAAKCYGSPLAAKLLGRTLCGVTNEEEWHRLLQDMPDPDEVVDDILSILKLSYELLPLNLKKCFAYCSIFPKGYEFDRDHLVQLWVSEDLLKPERIRESKTLEDIGRKQFTELLSRSFFQPCREPCGHNRYVMPGAIHDLAQSVSVYECVRVDCSGVQHGELTMARYASFCGDHLTSESVNSIYDRKHLRTLIFCTVGHAQVIHVQQQKLFSSLRFLRSLDLSDCKFDNLHESIGNLIHLRYLNLRGSLFKTLPDSICELSNLQTLNLDGCHSLKELPNRMSTLINMRHLGLSLNWENWDGEDFDSMPPYLGRLTSLQTLSRFSVAKGNGCGITELNNLNLYGELCISKLENVKNGNEASETQLRSKRHLKFLMLRWSERKSFHSVHEEEVIRQLCPSDEIRSIWIEGYNGSEFPPWVTNPSFKYLETLKLLNCKVCSNLPQVAKLPLLKRLYLTGLDKVKDLNQLVCQSGNSVEFQSLELLHLSDMPELENFIEPNVSLTKLCELSICNCPELKQITYLPSSLGRFELRNCTALMLLPPTLPSLSNLIVEGVDLKIIWWIQVLSSLISLSIITVPDLKCITGRNLSCLSRLTMLKIEGCNKLESMARNGGHQYLPSLKKLDISSCASFRMFCDQGLPCQIEELYLKDLKSLNSLPSGLDCLRHLHTLEIHDVPMLQSVPVMPPSLHFLSINKCLDLERRCNIGGLDWPNVSNVSCLLIGGTRLR